MDAKTKCYIMWILYCVNVDDDKKLLLLLITKTLEISKHPTT